MRLGRIFAVTVLVSGAVGGCVSVRVVRVDPAKVHGPDVEGSKTQTSGVLFYRPRPYLMVTQGPASKEQPADKPSVPPGAGTADKPALGGALNVEIIWLPDYSQEYEIQVHPGLGSVTMNPTLKDGWNLTGLSATADSKTAELITAATGLAKAIPFAARTAGQKPSCTGLYPIGMDRTTGLITGVGAPVIRFEDPGQCEDLK
jgi:hypothetical protein